MNDASKRLPAPRYFGEEFGTPLATWLNGEEQEAWGEWARSLEPMGFHMQGNAAIDRKARARITKVVEGLLELSRSIGLVDEKRLRAAEASVNRSLEIYGSHPSILRDEVARRDGGLISTINRKPYNPENPSSLLVWTDKQIGKYPFQELAAIGAIRELIRLSALERLRTCMACGRWMFARRPRAKLCPGRDECERKGKAIYYKTVFKKKKRDNEDYKARRVNG